MDSADKLGPVSLDSVRDAAQRIAGTAVRTPLVRLNVDEAEIYLKLENLQPIGSFKIRGAANLIFQTPGEKLADGVWTASAGNMAQGVAWCARKLGISCAVVVPESAPQTKLQALERMGARIVRASFDAWMDVFETRVFPGMTGLFVHAFADSEVMAGNGTIGLEILEDLPDVGRVIVPYGGGGLSCGIAAAIRAVKPSVDMFAAEVSTAAPLAASLEAGRLVDVDYIPSFVDGIGARRVFPAMWELSRDLLAGSLVATVEQIASTVRLLAERSRIVAEGAGAAATAAALANPAPGKTVCIVSGGNIDSGKLARILSGEMP